LGRKAVLIEREERYCEIAARRMGQGVLDFGTANVSGETE
jgi:site-specific DNA-methyltransferase (adenine-specific)